MEILGTIQGEGMEIPERERMQRQMRDFISRLQSSQDWKEDRVAYKVHFSRSLLGSKTDALIEFRAGSKEAWYARANGADPWRSFCRAMDSLKQMVTEMEMRKNADAKNDGSAA